MAKIKETRTTISASREIIGALDAIFGKPCCLQRAGERKSLTLGFGEKIKHSRPKAADPFNGEWELGSYDAAWRIILDEKIICGSMTPVDSNAEFESKIDAIKFGSVESIEATSKFDVRVTFTNRLSVEFLCASNENVGILHVFGPDHLFVSYRYPEGWVIKKSNQPTLSRRWNGR